MELAIECFQVITNRIHGSIVPQIGPVVKSIASDFHSVCLVGFDPAERIAAVLPDEQRIDRTDVQPGLVQYVGNRLVVAAGVLHNHAGLAVKRFELPGKPGQIFRTVTDIKRQPHDFSEWAEDGDCALSAGNINTCCVHVQTPVNIICNG